MAVYTNTLRYTGVSGVDTESMVTSLMRAEGFKLDRLKKSQQLVAWKQEAYRNVSTSLIAFRTSWLDIAKANNARSRSSFINNTSTVSTSTGAESNAVKFSTSSATKPGSYTMEVKQLATKDTYIASESVRGEIKTGEIDPANLKAGDKISLTLNGTTKVIELDKDYSTSSVDGLVTDINTKLATAFGYDNISGVNVPKVKVETHNIDANKKGLEFSTTPGHTLRINEGGTRNTAQVASNASVSGNYKLIADGKTFEFELKDGMKDDDIRDVINSALKKSGVNNLSASVSGGKITFAASGTKSDIEITVAADSEKNLADLGFTDGGAGATKVTVGRTSMLAGFNIDAGTTSVLDLGKKLSEIFGTSNGSFTINNIKIEYDENTTIRQLMDKLKNTGTGVTLSYDAISESFKLESDKTGSVNAINFGTDAANFFNNMKIDVTTANVSAQDAVFTINGKEFSRDTNTNIEVGDLRFSLNHTTEITAPDGTVNGYEELNINIGKDVSKTLEFIKSFVESYNTLLSGLNSQLTTNRAKSGNYSFYEPLTDDERKAMSESEITAWEEKAKQGLLYGDSLVKNVASSMRSMLYQSVDLGDGRKIGLYEIGITTSSNYWEGGKLEIDEEKLTTALQERGDDVAELFTKSSTKGFESGKSNRERLNEEGLSERLYDIIQMAVDLNGSLSKKAGVVGSYTELDNSLTKQLKLESERISEMMKYLVQKENYYYSMFSKMEQAINNNNSQMAYLQSQLGV